MNALILLSLALMPGDVRVSMLDGQIRNGDLKSITANDVTLTESGVENALPLVDVMSIDFSSANRRTPEDGQSVTLADGSQLFGTGVVRNAKTLTMANVALGNVEVENSSVRTVRLQPDNTAFRSQWNTFQQRTSDKDLLIVAKRDGTGLDFLAGVVSAISAEKIDFLLDGDVVPVPAARVYGVVFATPADTKAVAADGPLKLMTLHGDLVVAKTLKLDGLALQIETTWGQSISTSTQHIAQIDLSGGRVKYLSDLPPIEETFSGVDPEGSLFAGLISEEHQQILFGPRRDSSFEGKAKLRLRGREFAKGLCLHSRTDVSWAIDQRFSSFDCIIGIDDEVAFSGKHAVAVKITGDDIVLFEKLIATTDEPIALKLPVEGVATLAIQVDYGDGESTCDWLNLADAKLIITKPLDK